MAAFLIVRLVLFVSMPRWIERVRGILDTRVRELRALSSVRVSVAAATVHLIRYFHVTRNFTLDTVIRLALHLALLLELLGVVFHFVDRAS